LKDRDAAAGDFTQAISLGGPATKWAYVDRADCFIMKDAYSAALSDLNASLRADPYYRYPYRRRAFVYLHKRKPDPALADLDYLIRVGKPNAYLRGLKGWAYLQKGQAEAAAREYWEGLRIKDDGEAHCQLAFMHRYLGQYEAALVEANRAVHLRHAAFDYEGAPGSTSA
jgi:tetratricopeptide (TPR) repeat protein